MGERHGHWMTQRFGTPEVSSGAPREMLKIKSPRGTQERRGQEDPNQQVELLRRREKI